MTCLSLKPDTSPPVHPHVILCRPLTQLTHLDLGYVEVPQGGLDQITQFVNLQKCILYGRLNKLVAQVRVGQPPPSHSIHSVLECPSARWLLFCIRSLSWSR